MLRTNSVEISNTNIFFRIEEELSVEDNGTKEIYIALQQLLMDLD